MPSTSAKQKRTMAAAAHDPAFAKLVLLRKRNVMRYCTCGCGQQVMPREDEVGRVRYYPQCVEGHGQRKAQKVSKPVSLTDAAYAAGFFDGEGCISIALQRGATSRGKHYPNVRRYFLSVSLSQNDPTPIHWLVERFGGKCQFKRGKISYSDEQYERYDWHIRTNEALIFLRMVRPFLLVKAEQADIAFEFAETVEWSRRKTPLHVQEKRIVLYDRMKGIRNAFRIA